MDLNDKENLKKLLVLFNTKKKRDIEKYCRNLVITSEGFTSLILAGRATGVRPYLYECQFNEFVPEHLPPTKEELNALGTNGVGRLEGKARKAVSKVNQIFTDRRMFAAHLFYTPSFKFWHLFYFDQRDTESYRNHWKHGPHIHYSNDLIVKMPLQEIWNQVCLKRPKLPKSIHIKYDYHHNRGKR